MSKVRINDLARELEVKSRAILDSLTAVGVTEKKTHSSSLEEDEAERVRQHFQRTGGRNGAGAPKAVDNEPKQKIDWSRVSKPGDVLKAIQQRKDEAAAIAQRPSAPQAAQPQAAKPAIPARPLVSSFASSPASTLLRAPPRAPLLPARCRVERQRSRQRCRVQLLQFRQPRPQPRARLHPASQPVRVRPCRACQGRLGQISVLPAWAAPIWADKVSVLRLHHRLRRGGLCPNPARNHGLS